MLDPEERSILNQGSEEQDQPDTTYNHETINNKGKRSFFKLHLSVHLFTTLGLCFANTVAGKRCTPIKSGLDF